MVVELRTLRISSEFDSSRYVAGMQAKVDADRRGAESSHAAGAAIDAQKVSIGSAVPLLERLSRTYVDGYGTAAKFNAEILRLAKSQDTNAASVAHLEQVYAGMQSRFGLVANSTELAQRGYVGLASAIENVNSRLQVQAQAAERAASATSRVVAANQNRGGASGYTSNIAAQFQDIGVTAYGGMSPMTIALQQGTQLSAVFNDLQRSGQGVGAALTGAFTSILNPLSLVTIGVVAGSAALIQYFTSGDTESDKLNQKLEQQANLISRVARQWGDAYPALKAYSDELERSANASQLQEAQTAAAERRFSQLKTVMDTLVAASPEVSRSLRDITSPAATQAALAYEQAITDTRNALQKGKDPSEAFGRATSSLGTIVENGGTAKLREYRDQLELLGQAFGSASSQVEAFKMQLPTLGTLQGPWSENGKLYYPEQFTPANPGVPIRRPLIELEGMPGVGNGQAPTIVNSDGRLVNVPVPGQRPNYFEREADLPPYYRANRNTYWSREVLTEEMRRQQTGEMAKGFITDFGRALQENGGDLGKALMTSLSNAMMKASQEAWDRLATQLSNSLVNALMGPPSEGLMNKAIGFTGANTTLGQILGAGGAVGVNDNAAGGYSGLSRYQRAIQSIESSGNYGALGPVTRNGDRAYGAYQVMGNNIGPWSQAALGRSLSTSEFLRNPGLQDQIFNHRFGSYVNQYGPSGAAQAWFGGPGSVGRGGAATDMLGTSGSEYVSKFNSALTSLSGSASAASGSVGTFNSGLGTAAQGLGNLGTSFTSFGKSMLNYFPAAPSAPTGGGGLGSLFGGLGSMFGGGADLSKYIGMVGLFDSGGYTGPGDVHEPAGVVHRGEVVWSQRDIARAGGVATVEAMRLGYRGYAEGGTPDRIRPRVETPRTANDNVGHGRRNQVERAANIKISLDGARGDREIEDAAYRGMQQALREYDAGLDDRIAEHDDNPRWRRA